MLHGFKAVYPPDMQEYLQSIADFIATLLPPAALKGLPKSIIVDLICKERLNSFGHWSNQGKALGTAMYPGELLPCVELADFFANDTIHL
jgi:hypothetical protein